MGTIADAALDAGGEVVGVIPQALVDREIAHPGLTELHVVGSMHERKALMADLADGFVALPGGMGTLEELFEVYTWTQLGLHAKPLGLLDVRGYYAQLVAFLDHAVAERFVTAEHREMLVVEQRAGGAARGVQALAAAGAREVDRSLAVVSSASIAVGRGGAARPATATLIARAGARLEPAQHDGVADRRRRQRGDERDADAGEHEPPDRAVVVGGERDPRREAGRGRRRGVSSRLQRRVGARDPRLAARSRHRHRRRASAERVAGRQRDEHLVVAERVQVEPGRVEHRLEVVLEHDREVVAAVAQAVRGGRRARPRRG